MIEIKILMSYGIYLDKDIDILIHNQFYLSLYFIFLIYRYESYLTFIKLYKNLWIGFFK